LNQLMWAQNCVEENKYQIFGTKHMIFNVFHNDFSCLQTKVVGDLMFKPSKICIYISFSKNPFKNAILTSS
jgi:hypothetical protein